MATLRRKTKQETTRARIVLAAVLVIALAMTPLLAYTPIAFGEKADNAAEGTGTGTSLAVGTDGPTEEDPAEGQGEPAASEASGTASGIAQGTQQAPAAATQQAPNTGGVVIQEAQATQAIGNNLAVTVGNTAYGTTPVVSGQTYTWPWTNIPANDTRVLRINADFSEQGTDKERSITITVPRGYTIRGVSAPDTMDSLNGLAVSKLGLESSSLVKNVTYTGIEGITGYQYGPYSSTYPYSASGTITYTFNPNCESIMLDITLTINEQLLSNHATSTMMKPLTVAMNSGGEALHTTLNSRVTQLTRYGVTMNMVNETIASGIDSYTGAQAIYLRSGDPSTFNDKVTHVITYPEGVELVGIQDPFTLVFEDPEGFRDASVTEKTYLDGAVTIQRNAAERTVTITYNKVAGSSLSISPVWSYDVNAIAKSLGKVDANNQWNGTELNAIMKLATNVQSGAVLDTWEESNLAAQASIVFKRPVFDLKIDPLLLTRRDLNDTQDYPYEYLLGGFRNGQGPKGTTNVTTGGKYELSFDASMGARAIAFSLPTTLTNISAMVQKADGSIVSVTVPGSKAGLVTAQDLGLGEGDALVAFTADVDKVYSYGTVNYYGQFADSNPGEANIKVTVNGTATTSKPDTPKIGWNDAAVSYVKTYVDNVSAKTYYPSDTINFRSEFYAESTISSSGPTYNDIIDPVICISLPEGVALDPSSVTAQSLMGIHGGAPFSLKSLSDEPERILVDGIWWNTYRFTSNEPMEMLALSYNENVNGYVSGQERITVDFAANISSGCDPFTVLRTQDMVLWDLGRTTNNWTYGIADANNRAGHGTDYKLAVDKNSFLEIKPAPGLAVSMGIRSTGSGDPFRSYDGSNSSIAVVTPSNTAEAQLSFSNQSGTDYKKDSEIYIPVPKAGVDYAKYFYNLNSNPYSGDNASTTKPSYSLELVTQLSHPKFKTLYSYASDGAVNDAYGPSRTPVPDVFVTYDELIAAGKTLADVTMVKLVALDDIVTGDKGALTFEVTYGEDVEGAAANATNYWRTYQKGWRDDQGAGNYLYGSVVAVTPQNYLGSYKVEHWQEQTDGSYIHIGEDDELLPGMIGKAVSVAPKGHYPIHSFNAAHASGIPSGIVDAAGSLVLKAFYDLPRYQVVYAAPQATGGTLPTDGTAYYYGVGSTIADGSALVRDGYTFKGWMTAPENGSVPYQPGDFMMPGEAGQAGYGAKGSGSPEYTITLFAVWERVPESPPTTPGGGTGTPPDGIVIMVVPGILQSIVETLVGEPPALASAPSGDYMVAGDGTPLAGGDIHCWIHPWIILGIIVTLLYGLVVVVRRGRFISYLNDLEDDAMNGESSNTLPNYDAPGYRPAGQGKPA